MHNNMGLYKPRYVIEEAHIMRNERLVALRANRTQKELAKEIDIPVSTYAMIELGRRFPRRKLQAKLASHYKVTVDYLFFDIKNHDS